MKSCRPHASTVRLAVVVVLAVIATASATGTGAAATYTASPFRNKVLYVDPNSNAARDSAALATSDPLSSAALSKIATHSQADWFGDWIPVDQVAARVAARVTTITNAGDYPVLVTYDIPERDCHGYSGGGATSPDAFRAWIRAFKAGIGTRHAAVIVEPDALAQLGCLAAADQQTRLDLIKFAAQTIAAGGSVAVYLDAGNAGWIPASTMGDRLAKAGVTYARGFSLNVSSFDWTADEIKYGRQIAPLVGWKRFVIDTSRNGLGPAPATNDSWCNPSGRALGPAPTAETGDTIVDAELWIKRPGESDGTCNGGPAAGTWWRDYAVGLATRASW
jgi:endoglucanase